MNFNMGYREAMKGMAYPKVWDEWKDHQQKAYEEGRCCASLVKAASGKKRPLMTFNIFKLPRATQALVNEEKRYHNARIAP